MAKVDLHVHSSHSKRPSEWFLQRLGTKESSCNKCLLFLPPLTFQISLIK